jgi:exonuclease SbcD
MSCLPGVQPKQECQTKRASNVKILHTSDWHIGRYLHGKPRYREHEQFLEWLLETIHNQGVHVLIVAGDVFDTGTPSNRAQELYYRFLGAVARSHCRHVVITAGNHDSPTFLAAPQRLLQSLDVHVIGQAGALEDEVLALEDQQGNVEMIVCAVPYLRDRDIRTAEAGETFDDKERKLQAGIRQHYQLVVDHAETRRAALGYWVPVVATGHLFTSGGQTVEGDGVRDLYVGTAAHVHANIFPDTLDYVALGHLHLHQQVNASEVVRYSGSPLPMGFGEANQQKQVCLVRFAGGKADVSTLDIPVFQRLERIRGGYAALAKRVQELAATGESVWLEVLHDANEVVADLRERLVAMVGDRPIELLQVRSTRQMSAGLQWDDPDIRLEDLGLEDVFERCLLAQQVSDEQCLELRDTFREALALYYSADPNAG